MNTRIWIRQRGVAPSWTRAIESTTKNVIRSNDIIDENIQTVQWTPSCSLERSHSQQQGRTLLRHQQGLWHAQKRCQCPIRRDEDSQVHVICIQHHWQDCQELERCDMCREALACWEGRMLSR